MRIGDQRPGGLSRKFVRWARQGLSRRDTLFVLPAVGFSVGMLVYYLVFGEFLKLFPTVLLLASVPLLALLGSVKKSTRPWIPFVAIMVCYEALWGTVGSLTSARDLFSIYPVDKMIWGFNLTGWIQSTFYSWSLTALTTFFYSLQLPLVVAASVILWRFNRKVFSKFVSALVITSYAALVTFLVLPTAPPWYAGVAHDLFYGGTSSMLPGWMLSLSSIFESDKFAAFPSLHAAYAIIFSYFMIRLDRRLAVVAVPITVGILFSTLYLGQHYLIDLLGGAVYALVPCLIAERLQMIPHRTASGDAGSLGAPGGAGLMRAAPPSDGPPSYGGEGAQASATGYPDPAISADVAVWRTSLPARTTMEAVPGTGVRMSDQPPPILE